MLVVVRNMKCDFFSVAVSNCSIWSIFFVLGVFMGQIQGMFCAQMPSVKGGARIGCGVGAMSHQAWPIKTAKQKQSNNLWIHFSGFLSISIFCRQIYIFMNPPWFFAAALQAGSFYPAPPYEVCWRWRCCAMIWPGTFWMSMGRRNGVLRFLNFAAWCLGPLEVNPSILNHFESGGGLNGTQTQESNFLAGNVNVA